MERPEPLSDIERLIEIATSKDAPEGEELSEIDRFILAMGIKEGNAKVHCPFLYKAYEKWAGRKRLSRMVFYTEFKKRFQQRCWNGYRFYFLDPAPFDLSEDARLEIVEERRKRRSGQKRKNKKKQHQVPGPSEGSQSQD